MNAFSGKGFGIALLFLGLHTSLCAQIDLSKFQLGLTGGVFVYQGDLSPARLGSYNTLRPTVNLFVNRRVNPSFSLRTSLFYGGLRGDDASYSDPAWRKQRNFNFHSSVFELSELLVWNTRSTDKKAVPYLFAGAGLSWLQIRRDWSRFNGEFFLLEDLSVRLAEDIAHKTPGLLPVFPLGAGIHYSITKKLSVIAETSYRLTRTDYLDGFSKAANSEFYDHYQSHTLGIVYRFGKTAVDCPAIVR